MTAAVMKSVCLTTWSNSVRCLGQGKFDMWTEWGLNPQPQGCRIVAQALQELCVFNPYNLLKETVKLLIKKHTEEPQSSWDLLAQAQFNTLNFTAANTSIWNNIIQNVHGVLKQKYSIFSLLWNHQWDVRHDLQQLQPVLPCAFSSWSTFYTCNCRYFPLVDVDVLSLSVSMPSPITQLCVRSGNFELCNFHMMTYARLKSLKKGLDSSLRGFGSEKFFFYFVRRKRYVKKMLHSLTYLRADRGNPGGEPVETFIFSPSCRLTQFIEISCCRVDGGGWWLIEPETLSKCFKFETKSCNIFEHMTRE